MIHLTKPATLHPFVLGAKDAAGDMTGGFGVDVPTRVELQQQVGELGTTELRDNRMVSVTRWVAFLPPSLSVSGLDELSVDGARYSFDGDPWLVRNPRTGRASHWQAKLKKVS